MGMGIDLSFLDFYLDDTRAGCPGDYLRVVEGSFWTNFHIAVRVVHYGNSHTRVLDMP